MRSTTETRDVLCRPHSTLSHFLIPCLALHRHHGNGWIWVYTANRQGREVQWDSHSIHSLPILLTCSSWVAYPCKVRQVDLLTSCCWVCMEPCLACYSLCYCLFLNVVKIYLEKDTIYCLVCLLVSPLFLLLATSLWNELRGDYLSAVGSADLYFVTLFLFLSSWGPDTGYIFESLQGPNSLLRHVSDSTWLSVLDPRNLLCPPQSLFPSYRIVAVLFIVLRRGRGDPTPRCIPEALNRRGECQSSGLTPIKYSHHLGFPYASGILRDSGRLILVRLWEVRVLRSWLLVAVKCFVSHISNRYRLSQHIKSGILRLPLS